MGTSPTPPTQAATDAPTNSPIEASALCPAQSHWTKVQLVNYMWSYKAPSAQKRLRRGKCRSRGFKGHFCTYPDGTFECRPGFNANGERIATDMACPSGTSVHPFDSMCEMFPNCPPAEEMSACYLMNYLGGHRYKLKRCTRNKVVVIFEGITYEAAKGACAYKNGVCRAYGEYTREHKKLLFHMPGFFDREKLCLYAHTGTNIVDPVVKQ